MESQKQLLGETLAEKTGQPESKGLVPVNLYPIIEQWREIAEHNKAVRLERERKQAEYLNSPNYKLDRQNEEMEREVKRMRMLKAGSKIPERYKDASLASLRGNGKIKAQEYAGKFEPREWSCLTIIGDYGKGKTYMACAIGNKLMESGATVLFAGAVDIISEIKKSWGRNSDDDYEAIIRNYQSPDLLIIDDFGINYGTDTDRIEFYRIIDERYNTMKSIVVTSNLTVDELKDKMGRSIVRRLMEDSNILVVD